LEFEKDFDMWLDFGEDSVWVFKVKIGERGSRIEIRLRKKKKSPNEVDRGASFGVRLERRQNDDCEAWVCCRGRARPYKY